MAASFGKVYLVGAGPGDPGLLTVRGRELLERADVVVYDSLVDEGLLALAPKAEAVFVGKRPGRHALEQSDINRILIEQAARAGRVVRLKGGDPLLFGRGGEEALALAAAGVPFEIVPGVTAALGAAAYAGIPVTQRGIAGTVSFVTGHLEPGAEGILLDRIHLEGTLVFYMITKNLPKITDELLRLGRPADTPAAVVQQATLPRQRVVQGTLGDIARRCADAKIEPPAVLMVGRVVELRKTLAWFEGRPLHGRRVAVTRTSRGPSRLAPLLIERGADVFEFPTVEFSPTEAMRSLGDLAEYDWIVLTSTNAVDALFDHLAERGWDARGLAGVRICAVGLKTTEAIRARRLRPDAVSETYETDGVLRVLEEAGGLLRDRKVLLPRADVARSALREGLLARGAHVTELAAYGTGVPRNAAELADALVRYRPHYVAFASSAAARNLARVLGPERLAALSKQAVFAAVGPNAARAARELGMRVEIEPVAHRLPDLVEALAAWDAAHRGTR